MADQVTIKINGQEVVVARGTSVAVAMAAAGVPSRYSISGQPRAPLCGMGVCFECRATINGVPHLKTCQVECADGMEVASDG